MSDNNGNIVADKTPFWTLFGISLICLGMGGCDYLRLTQNDKLEIIKIQLEIEKVKAGIELDN